MNKNMSNFGSAKYFVQDGKYYKISTFEFRLAEIQS